MEEAWKLTESYTGHASVLAIEFVMKARMYMYIVCVEVLLMSPRFATQRHTTDAPRAKCRELESGGDESAGHSFDRPSGRPPVFPSLLIDCN